MKHQPMHYVYELKSWVSRPEAIEFYRAHHGEEWLREWMRGGNEAAAGTGAQGRLL